MFELLEQINSRPKPFAFYTAAELWTNEYTSQQMLQYHLNPDVDISSRKLDFIVRSVNWMVKTFSIDAQTKIADFGCGPGLYTTKLAQNNAQVTGIDFSPRSIAYAKEIALKESLAIKYFNQNYLEFESDEQFDMIVMIMCDFCALSPEQRKAMLRNYKSLLKPNGVLILDMYSLNAFNKKTESATYEKNQLFKFWGSNDYYGFVNSFIYANEKVTLDQYTIIEKDKVKTVYNWLQYFSLESIEQELKNAGLTIKTKYGNVAGDDYDGKADEFALVVGQ